MAIPDFQTLMLPSLEYLADGEVRRVVPDVTDALASRFKLSLEDREQILPSGAMTTFVNRTHWVATYFTKAGLVERPRAVTSESPIAGSRSSHRSRRRSTSHIFVRTTSYFTADAEDYVRRISRRIVLVDGRMLARLMYEYRIAVRSHRSLAIKRLDDAYFADDVSRRATRDRSTARRGQPWIAQDATTVAGRLCGLANLLLDCVRCNIPARAIRYRLGMRI